MPVNVPFSTQLVLQMSSAVEKVQMQQVLHLAVDQLVEEEQAKLNEAKRVEVQGLEDSKPPEPTNPEGNAARRGRVRIKKKIEAADKKEQAQRSTSTTPGRLAEAQNGTHLDVVV